MSFDYANRREVDRQQTPAYKAFMKWLNNNKHCDKKARRDKLEELCGK